MAIKLILFDMDHCIHPGDRYETLSHEKWVIQTNKDFLDGIADEINKKKYSKVVVGYGTNRQSHEVDSNPGNKTNGGSSAPTLPLIQGYLASQTQVPVVFDPLLMADVYSDKNAGESHALILKSLDIQLKTSKKEETKHPKSLFYYNDKSHILYTHIHRIAGLYPQEDIEVEFFDDGLGHLENVNELFGRNPDLLSQNVTLKLTRREFGQDPKELRIIKGTGAVDDEYLWTVHFMATQYVSFSENSSAYVMHENDNLEELILIQKQARYCFDFPAAELWSTSKQLLQLKRFLLLETKKKLPELKAERIGYKTLDQLIAEDLLPEKMAIAKLDVTKVPQEEEIRDLAESINSFNSDSDKTMQSINNIVTDLKNYLIWQSLKNDFDASLQALQAALLEEWEASAKDAEAIKKIDNLIESNKILFVGFKKCYDIVTNKDTDQDAKINARKEFNKKIDQFQGVINSQTVGAKIFIAVCAIVGGLIGAFAGALAGAAIGSAIGALAGSPGLAPGALFGALFGGGFVGFWGAVKGLSSGAAIGAGFAGAVIGFVATLAAAFGSRKVARSWSFFASPCRNEMKGVLQQMKSQLDSHKAPGL